MNVSIEMPFEIRSIDSPTHPVGIKVEFLRMVSVLFCFVFLLFFFLAFSVFLEYNVTFQIKRIPFLLYQTFHFFFFPRDLPPKL